MTGPGMITRVPKKQPEQNEINAALYDTGIKGRHMIITGGN